MCLCGDKRSGQARKEVQCLVTEDGSNWKLAVDIKKKMEEAVKEFTRGRKKIRVVATEDEESSNLAEAMCVYKQPRVLTGWMTPS